MTNREVQYILFLAVLALILGLVFSILDDLLGAFIAVLFVRLWDNRHIFEQLMVAEDD